MSCDFRLSCPQLSKQSNQTVGEKWTLEQTSDDTNETIFGKRLMNLYSEGFYLAHGLFANMEGEGLISYAAASHQVEMFCR